MNTTNTEKNITFLMPEQLGNTLIICNDEYNLFYPGERLTDSFLDYIISLKKSPSFPSKYTLYDDNVSKKSPIVFNFFEDSITITYENSSTDYFVSFNAFADAFIENVRKYALYYAAPCNYKAMFTASFDDMIKKLSRYRDKAADIIKKIQ